MSAQYGDLPTSCWDRFISFGHPIKFQRFSCLGSVTVRHSNIGRQSNSAALNRGCHLYSAGWPSRWALAHIQVLFDKICIYRVPVNCDMEFMETTGNFSIWQTNLGTTAALSSLKIIFVVIYLFNWNIPNNSKMKMGIVFKSIYGSLKPENFQQTNCKITRSTSESQILFLKHLNIMTGLKHN